MNKRKANNGCLKFDDKGFAAYLVHLGYNLDRIERMGDTTCYCFRCGEIGDTPALRERILATAIELYLKGETLVDFSELVHTFQYIEEIEKESE